MSVTPSPDICLINAGLHMKTPEDLTKAIDALMILFGDPRIRKSLVWRDSSIQHFPSLDGSYDTWNTSVMACDQFVCADKAELSSVSMMRHELPRKYFAQHGLNILFLDMAETELHYYKTYPQL
eukprot:CAMPEP_0113658956 /NCGR_PEP_ID=MMETSP0017_2-20120614/32059_1 /TAXON_ID=2856 /ORGANISM="Cylindrotheca closterium" /LENGTH=123 /DNA_ID=CAMNT_0000573391 /DNA_START=818 /DNA_END=1185 /DNA_ORIENTATION=- /assembly_acc=CAM_ASM_000147